MNTVIRSLAFAPFACLVLLGCRVSTSNNGNGKNDNVDISTPFGSMHVKGNDAADVSAIGISLYPGAVPVKDDDGKGNDAADVNMSFGDFHLGVKAASFQTPDGQEKVLTFYRKDLAKYGDVIECRGDQTIGSPAKTSQGLTCADKDSNHVSTQDHGKRGISVMDGSSSSSNNLELRAGSEQHQHIVGVEARNGGTKIGLVNLDLPSHLGDHDGKSVE
jgi:hypothetical protein